MMPYHERRSLAGSLKSAYSTALVISSELTRESLRCPASVRIESLAYHELFELRSLTNRCTFRSSLTTTRQDAASLVMEACIDIYTGFLALVNQMPTTVCGQRELMTSKAAFY